MTLLLHSDTNFTQGVTLCGSPSLVGAAMVPCAAVCVGSDRAREVLGIQPEQAAAGTAAEPAMRHVRPATVSTVTITVMAC
jgi:hypothetical protein